MANPVVWFEILGKDSAKLRRFYGDLFDWKIEVADGEMGYGVVAGGEGGIGGGMGRSTDGGDGFVTFYVEVDDPTAYLEEVERMGGKVIVPPTEIPAFNLTFAYFADPEGHVVGLSRGAVQ